MPEQRADVAVAAGLGQHALAGIDQDDRRIGVGGAGGHVARVLLVARRIGDDEGAARRGEEAVGDIDGDALLALGLEPVDQQRQIDVLAGGAVLAAVARQGRELVLENQLGVVQQPADERRFAIVHRAAGQEAQQALLAPASAVSIRSILRASSFHRGRLVAVDEAAGALRGARGQHLLDDVIERGGRALDRRRQRIAAQGAEAHHARSPRPRRAAAACARRRA